MTQTFFNAVFLNINEISETELLEPFQEALALNENSLPEDILNAWGALEDENYTETKEDRNVRLIQFLEYACGAPELLMGDPQNLEEISHILFYFLDNLDLDVKEPLYEQLAEFFTSIQHNPELQLEMCSILLNLIPRCDDVSTSLLQPHEQEALNRRWGNCRARVFDKILQFAIQSKRGELFRGRLTRELFKSWKLEEEQELYANLLWSSYQLLKQTRDAKEEAHQFLLEYLKRRPGAEKSIDGAWNAIYHVITSETNSPRALMEVYSLDAVRRLQNSKWDIFYQLLYLLYQGKVFEYTNFLAQDDNANDLENLGLSETAILFKIQQLTLCDIGREPGGSLQDLDELKERLRCESAHELERVVQAAQQQGLLEALFDYSQNTLRLHKVALRVFQNRQECWDELAMKLQQWSHQTSEIVQKHHDSVFV